MIPAAPITVPKGHYMTHPGVAILETIIEEEEAKVAACVAERQAIMEGQHEGASKRDMVFLMSLTDCESRQRNASLVIRFAEIQLAALPQSW